MSARPPDGIGRRRRPLSHLALSLLTLAALVTTLPMPPARAACCYFAAQDKDINQPGQKAYITWNPEARLESFTVQPKFEGNAVDFGMVIPTPSQPKLDEMPRDFFKDLALYTILMPLPEPIWTGLDEVPMPPVPTMAMAVKSAPGSATTAVRRSTVRVLESGVVGSLDYKIIAAGKADDLFQWLKDNRYSYAGDEKTLDFYIQKKWLFTVMKIDPRQMKKGDDGSYQGEVTPTRFTFKSAEPVYPLKITQISVKDQTDALFYVQAPTQMDLKGDLSWQHSYRVMYLTFMLGCGAGPVQQRELEKRQTWVDAKIQKDPNFETTKLEWARKLGAGDMAVVENPLKHYAQGGVGDLPPGAKVIPLATFLEELRAGYIKRDRKLTPEAKQEIESYREQYPPSRGVIVKNPRSAQGSFISTRYSWYPNREAPEAEIKGLVRLRGHLKSGQWLTKFRKVLRNDEMTDDLVLVPVKPADNQTYVRIMPTSPP